MTRDEQQQAEYVKAMNRAGYEQGRADARTESRGMLKQDLRHDPFKPYRGRTEWDAIEAFYAAVNKRAEADIINGRPVTGAHHRALKAEIEEVRAENGCTRSRTRKPADQRMGLSGNVMILPDETS